MIGRAFLLPLARGWLGSSPSVLLTSSVSIRFWHQGGEPLRGTHGVLPAGVPAIERLECALDNLAFVATNNSAVLQQLTAATLALTTPVTALTATDKSLVDSVVKAWAAANPTVMAGSRHLTGKPWPRNYC